MQTQYSTDAFAGANLPQGANLPFVYLPIAAVRGAVGFSTSRIYELIKAGEFPPGDLIGRQSRRWKSTDISAWLEEQSAKSAQREADIGVKLTATANRAASASRSARLQRAGKEANHAPA